MNILRLIHPLLSDTIVFEENKINILILENGALFAKFIQEFSSQINGMEGDFVFSEDYKPIPMGKNIELITDIFSIDINSRKIMAKLMDMLAYLAVDEDFYLKTCDVKQTLNQYMESLLIDFEYSLSYDTAIDLCQVFKALKVEVHMESKSILEFLVEYLSLLSKLLNIKCVVLTNLKSFLSHEELSLLYKEIMYKKYCVLLLENHAQENIFPCEKIRIIDNDLCEIKINH